jgi:hypothetical protein
MKQAKTKAVAYSRSAKKLQNLIDSKSSRIDLSQVNASPEKRH